MDKCTTFSLSYMYDIVLILFIYLSISSYQYTKLLSVYLTFFLKRNVKIATSRIAITRVACILRRRAWFYHCKRYILFICILRLIWKSIILGVWTEQFLFWLKNAILVWRSSFFLWIEIYNWTSNEQRWSSFFLLCTPNQTMDRIDSRFNFFEVPCIYAQCIT